MLHELRDVGKDLVAVRAKQLLSRVDPHVRVQTSLQSESFITVRAGERDL